MTNQPPSTSEDYTPSTEEGQAGQTQNQQNPTVEMILTRLRADPLRFGILALGVVSVLMNWVTVSVLGGSQAAPGFDILGGKLYLLGILVLIGVEFAVRDYRHDAWLIGGAALTLVSVGSLLYIQSRIDEAMASMGIFAGAVEASLGLGIYVAVVVALVITYIGYTNSSFDVNEYTGDS